jgi:GTP-binding protein Era
MAEDQPLRRAGFVALIGVPNSGKSTLVNSLVGAKVTIVSRKAQTTRAQIRGIAMEGASQIVLVDTPGIFAPKRRLDRAMVDSAWGGAADADLVGLLVDARKADDPETRAIIGQLAASARKAFLVINKIDTLAKEKLIPVAANLNALFPFEATFMVAALSGYGVADLRRWLAGRVPAGPWLYPEEDVSDAPLRFLAAEITREKMFERLHDELPYRSTVETTGWEDRKDGSARVEQTIFVEREGQRKIVLGESGSTIRSIGSAARREIGEAAGKTVHLFLFVKVRENWESDPERYREMGLEFPRE